MQQLQRREKITFLDVDYGSNFDPVWVKYDINEFLYAVSARYFRATFITTASSGEHAGEIEMMEAVL